MSNDNLKRKYEEAVSRIAKAIGLNNYKIVYSDDVDGYMTVTGDRMNIIQFTNIIYFLRYECKGLRLGRKQYDFDPSKLVFGSGKDLTGSVSFLVKGWIRLKIENLDDGIRNAQMFADNLQISDYSFSNKCTSNFRVEIDFLEYLYFREKEKVRHLLYYKCKLFNGLMIEYNADETLRKETEIYNGVLHGNAKIFYENGDIMESISFCNGSRHGKLIGYRKTKQKKYDALFEKNKMVRLNVYNSKGQLLPHKADDYNSIRNGYLPPISFFQPSGIMSELWALSNT